MVGVAVGTAAVASVAAASTASASAAGTTTTYGAVSAAWTSAATGAKIAIVAGAVAVAGISGAAIFDGDGGDVRATLEWDSTADIDMFVFDPLGSTLTFGRESSESGGQYQGEANHDCEGLTSPSETVFWPDDSAPSGEYVVGATYTAECAGEGDQAVRLTLSVDGETDTFDVFLSPGQSIEITRFTR